MQFPEVQEVGSFLRVRKLGVSGGPGNWGFPGAQEIVNFDRFLLADLYYGSRFNWKQLEQDLMTEKVTKERIATARTDRTMKKHQQHRTIQNKV